MSGRLAVGLVMHPRNPVDDSIRVITEYGRRHEADVLVRDVDAGHAFPGVEVVTAEAFLERTQVLLSLGGDGTMLGAMRLVAGRAIPVLGVNHGNLGFLTEVTPEHLAAALDRLADDRFTLEPHSCVELSTGQVAFNDVVVGADRPLTTVTVDLSVNGSRYGYYRGDAVIACTPIGSTAYNFAAGGPVLSPSAAALALTPVAPMAGISRSAVFGTDDLIVLENPSETQNLQVTLDGTPFDPLTPGGKLSLRLRPGAVDIVRLDADAHAMRSRVVLSLLDMPLRPEQILDLMPQALREQAEQLRAQHPSPPPF